MKVPIRILHLEDNPNDAALIHHTLRSNGIKAEITCVDGRDEFVTALESGGIDLVLADFSLPGFDGLSAVKIVRGKVPDLPIILVSGTLGEEVAIDSLKSGATDYVLKERLSRLGLAVRRAMQEVEEVTERRRLEAQFIAAQKMEVLGQLAGGVAHDFNNVLAAIMGYSDLLLAELGPNEVLSVLELNRVARDLEKMLHRLIYGNITLTLDLGDDIGLIRADSGHIGQLILNLVVNARDAMPQGGKIVISTENRTLPPDQLPDAPGAAPGHFVVLRVSDSGMGMTEEVKSRLFEAFFTTKPAGRGTGLGLSTCQTIVQHSGGFIHVTTALGKGTTFAVYFPRVESDSEAAPVQEPSGPLPHGTETILMIEDDPSVRALSEGVLQSQGYTVISARDGADATQKLREWKGSPVRLIISDVILSPTVLEPSTTLFSQGSPKPRLLYTSGYTDAAFLAEWPGDLLVYFLPKPFTPARLARKAREVLD